MHAAGPLLYRQSEGRLVKTNRLFCLAGEKTSHKPLCLWKAVRKWLEIKLFCISLFSAIPLLSLYGRLWQSHARVLPRTKLNPPQTGGVSCFLPHGKAGFAKAGPQKGMRQFKEFCNISSKSILSSFLPYIAYEIIHKPVNRLVGSILIKEMHVSIDNGNTLHVICENFPIAIRTLIRYHA